MVIGAVLSLGRVSFAVAVEGRDRRRRVAAVDHRPPPTETGAPVARSSASLLHPQPESRRGAGGLMPPAGEVSFELERFEWTADDRLEVRRPLERRARPPDRAARR